MIDASHPLFDDDQLGTADRLVALAVVLLADGNGWCWASNASIARLANVHRTNAPKHLKKLADRGWLETQKKPADRRQTGYFLVKVDGVAPAISPQIAKVDGVAPSISENTPKVDGVAPPISTDNPKLGGAAPSTLQPASTQKIRDKEKEKEKETHQVELLDPAPKTPAKKPARRCTKKPKLPIAEDWLPSEATMANLVQIRKIPEQFVKDEIIEFVIYWHDQGESRASWDATFCNRVKSAWKWSQNDEKKQKYTDATGRPISEYDKTWRDMGEQAWEGSDGSYELGTSLHRDADGNNDVLI